MGLSGSLGPNGSLRPSGSLGLSGSLGYSGSLFLGPQWFHKIQSFFGTLALGAWDSVAPREFMRQPLEPRGFLGHSDSMGSSGSIGPHGFMGQTGSMAPNGVRDLVDLRTQ